MNERKLILKIARQEHEERTRNTVYNKKPKMKSNKKRGKHY